MLLPVKITPTPRMPPTKKNSTRQPPSLSSITTGESKEDIILGIVLCLILIIAVLGSLKFLHYFKTREVFFREQHRVVYPVAGFELELTGVGNLCSTSPEFHETSF